MEKCKSCGRNQVEGKDGRVKYTEDEEKQEMFCWLRISIHAKAFCGAIFGGIGMLDTQ